MQAYPARWIGVVMSALTLLVAFGVVALTPVQLDAVAALLVAVAGVIPVIQGLFTERKVYAPASVEAERLEARGDGYDAGYAKGRGFPPGS